MRRKGTVIMALSFLLIIGIVSAAIVMAADGGFTIKKVDQNREPLEDVEFEVYGKPTLGVAVTIRKIRNFDEGVATGTDGGQEARYTEAECYIDQISTIVVEGIDGDYHEEFQLGHEGEKKLALPPGRYKISEPAPIDLNEAEEGTTIFTAKRQYTLEEYIFEVGENGVITPISDEETTEWRISFKILMDPVTYYSILYSEVTSAYYMVNGWIDVIVRPGNVIQIENFAMRQDMK